MSNERLKLKKGKMKLIKYFIFSCAFLLTLFVSHSGLVKAEGLTGNATFELFESNHEGDNTKTHKNEAVQVCSTAGCDKQISETPYNSGWYVQTTGVQNKDTVSFKLVITTNVGSINGFTVFEESFSSSAGANASYDAYAKHDTVWKSVPGAGLKNGNVLTSLPAAGYLDADDNTLVANNAAGTYYSLVHITETTSGTAPNITITITINYVYTIRSNDYGEKIIYFAIYDTEPYDFEDGEWKDPMVAQTFAVRFVASKPADEFDIKWVKSNKVLNSSDAEVGTISLTEKKITMGTAPSTVIYTIDDMKIKNVSNKVVGSLNGNEFTINETGGSYNGTYKIDFGATGTAGVNQTNDIAIEYVNNSAGNKQTGTKNMLFVLPQEMAYLHNVDGNTAATIPNNTIYSINTFTNKPGGGTVKYYYYNFAWNGTDNIEMDPSKTYNLYLVIDATGSYTFYITDVFGNTISSVDTGSEDVDVEDVSNSTLIVDYTNAQNLTLLTASVCYDDLGTTDAACDGTWKNNWVFEFNTNEKIDFTKMVLDDTIVELHTFHKIAITQGVFAGGENIEDIAKQPLEKVDSDAEANASVSNVFTAANFEIWRVATISGDAGSDTNVSCEIDGDDATETNCFKKVDASSLVKFETSTSTYGGLKNKVTFNVTNNGRYRVKITDNYSNTTNNPIAGGEKNPGVEVTIIDKTSPNITSGLTTDTESADTSIETYAYVKGGGEKETYVPYSESDLASHPDYYKTGNYSTIYYEVGGSKAFDYEDALKIAQIKVDDKVWYYDGTNFDTEYADYDLYMYSHASAGTNMGKYIDPSAAYKSDRNTTAAKTTNDSGENMHEFIINKNITSYTGGLVRQVGYTGYESDDYTKVVDGRENPFVNNKDGDVGVEGGYGTFLGYFKIVFKRANTSDVVCELKIDEAKDGTNPASTTTTATSDADNLSCMKKINKMIDDVEDFDMVFTAYDYEYDASTPNDYRGHISNEYTVTVSIVDTTNPGIVNVNPLEYTNTNTTCKLEIGNFIQSKADLLECYKLTTTSGSVRYNFKDNNVHSPLNWDKDESANYVYDYEEEGYQYYAKDGNTDLTVDSSNHYFNKIKLFVYEATLTGGVEEIDVDGDTPFLKKSGDHIIRVEIYDHWTTMNKLTFYINYYVNPRTLLIEPLATEKMYGENDPTLEYCVYVNSHNETFNLEAAFFDVEFINTYFTNIYCTKDVYAEITNAKKYKVGSTSTKPLTDGSGLSYTYNNYVQDNAGTYLKVNNTYVEIKAANTYNGGYKQNNAGEYLKVENAYYPIKSGYLYTDDKCQYAYMGTGNMYLNISTGCKPVTVGNRYEYVYTSGTETGVYYDGRTYLKYNTNDVKSGKTVNEALVNNNSFQGQLTRVESSCYNSFAADGTGVYSGYVTSCASADAIATRNDNVGQYHIALGTLSIKPEGTSPNIEDYNEDYVIKINTNYFAEKTNFQQLPGATGSQTRDAFDDNGKLVDDTIYAESNVNFTIRQAVLTITTTGSSKKYGEQDPYSNVWNNKTTQVNSEDTGYLGGYTVHGWRNDDDEDGNNTLTAGYIIDGTLRREVGEEVGIYTICNVNSNPKTVGDSCIRTVSAPGYYDATNIYYFDAYDLYNDDGTSNDAAGLHIRTNNDIYGNGTGRKLNTGTRNYAISFVNNNKLTIEAVDLIIQPGVNQGKEYSKDEYHDPLWELVIYGETDISDGFDESGANADDESEDTNFNGYTTDVTSNANAHEREIGLEPYYTLTNSPQETEVYFARRKTSPDTTYKYAINDLTGYTKYKLDNGIYYKDNTNGTYIYAYGKYYEVGNASTYSIVVDGKLVNESYSLFGDNGLTVGATGYKAFALERETGATVGWYTYNTVYNYKTVTGEPNIYTIKPVTQREDKQCLITTSAITINANDENRVMCRNYNVVYKNLAPNQASNVYTTTHTATPNQVYEPDGTNACTNGSVYSKACDTADSMQILFEIFKREIIVKFIDDNYTFIYGNRYSYYDGGMANGATEYTYNSNTNGVLNIKNATSEGDIFLCYSDLDGDYLVDCTNNADYGLTAGDTWSNIGLRFYLHDTVGKVPTSGISYYGDDASTRDYSADKAVPAGTYFVYAEIGAINDYGTNNDILNNYKFTYKGGTLTIKPKTTSVELTGYTMEYGESSYSSYGTGSNYSEYDVYGTCVMLDSYYLESNADNKELLINASNCATTNTVGNTYGFVIEGLDTNDTIANNFKGRPARETRRTGNVGVYDDVGYYEINVGTIDNIQDKSVSFTRCVSNVGNTACIFVGDPTSPSSDVNAKNYDITYSLNNNEGAYLFITPAQLDIDVEPNQTKMYGCAYYTFKTTTTDYYNYSYAGGYVTDDCAQGSSPSLDMAYRYNVKGDKDVGAEYYIDTDTTGARSTNAGTNATKIVLSDTRLYRVTKESDNIYEYGNIRGIPQNAKYQGQSVGVYTITLGNLDVKNNINSLACDAYNNPLLANSTDTRFPCKNYNINYYGNSTTTDISAHKYTEVTEVEVANLAKYVLNYTEDANGEYIYINGKYVKVSDVIVETGANEGKVLVNAYLDKTDTNVLPRYRKLADYERIDETACNNDLSKCFVYVDLNLADTTPATYVAVNTLGTYRYNDYNGTDQDAAGSYLKIGSNLIKLATLTKYKSNANDYVLDNANGTYVLINEQHVQLSSLKTYKYNNTTKTYNEDATGSYVLVYEYRELDEFTRYKLSATSATMYKQDQSAAITDNVYVFINGSYVPYKSLVINNGKITVNMARLSTDGADDGTELDEARGTVTTDTDFTITARIVYVHPEYNVKPFQDDDPLESISCAEIQAAYYNSNNKKDGRTYCSNYAADGDKIDLGVTRYYAIENSLAKSPWTAWTDSDVYTVDGNTVTHTYALYDDIQYDVLTGKISRRMTTTAGKDDLAGKYTYDFVNVTNDKDRTINGENYMIVHVTKTAMNATYVDDNGAAKTLDTLVYESCNRGDLYCANVGNTDALVRVKNNTFAYNGTSISLIQKYKSAGLTDAIDYWYQGFYKDDETEGRSGELAQWWDEDARGIFSFSYNKIINRDNSLGDTLKSKYEIEYTDFSNTNAKEVYFEIIRRTIYLYAVDAEKTYGEADNYNDFLVAICANDAGYIKDGIGIKCASTEANYAFGLGAADLELFVDDDGYMIQNKIKNNGNEGEYIFQGNPGTTKESFGIYFRRDNNENAGSYTITACATQSDIVDCTNVDEDEVEHTSMRYLGDNYKIIEISGIFTINPRQININPHSNQGFEYGNYTTNGAMPNITFTESSVLGSYTPGVSVTVNSVTYTIDGTSIKKREIEVGTVDTTNNKLTINGVTYTISGTDILSSGGLVFGDGVHLYEGTTKKATITVTDTNNVLVNEFTIGTTTYYIDGLDVINKETNKKEGRINIDNTTVAGVSFKTLTVGGKTYDLVQKAKCLINVSGLYTVCINDAQNEKLGVTVANLFDANGDINTKFAEYGANYEESALTTSIRRGANVSDETTQIVKKATKSYYNYNVYADTYSDPARTYSRSETDTRNALNVACGTNYNVRYSRDVCEYNIVIENADGSTKYLTIDGNVKDATTTYFYIHLSESRLYKLSGTDYVRVDSDEIATATHVRYGNNYADLSTATRYRLAEPNETGVTKVDGRYVLDPNGNYIQLANNVLNYTIVGFDNTKKFTITPATLEVTPDSLQYKVYGEADPEIEFKVKTTYDIANTQYRTFAGSNIVEVCNGASECFTSADDINTLRYNYNTTNKAWEANTSGTHILLIRGWTVTLSTYAYGETNGNSELDYGKNFTATKHDATASPLNQNAGNSVTHYDKYTSYNESINTDRILLGNLFVTDHDQSVGVKIIANGLKIALNNLSETNYTLAYVDDSSTFYRFTIIPRPVNVEIENITKTYGQATDSTSCDSSYSTECIVGDGILNGQDNGSLLINNYNVIDKSFANQTITITNIGNITVNYANAYNMPTETSAELIEGDTYKNYVTVVANHYYTETYEDDDTDKVTGLIEEKNDTLNIKVVRENHNISRGSNGNTCLATVSGETYCEDVGEYFLSFAVRDTVQTIETAITNAYYNSYWGYNPNYYVIVYNNFEVSGWATDEYLAANTITAANNTVYYAGKGQETVAGSGIYAGIVETSNVINEETLAFAHTYKDDDLNTVPGPTATLKIRKRAIQVVVETISEYKYSASAIVDGKGAYIKDSSDKYHLITDTNRYKKVGTTYVQLARGTVQAIKTTADEQQYVCTYVANNVNTDANCIAITGSNTFNRESFTVGEKYNIEQNMDIPQTPVISNRGLNNAGKHHTTYEFITWYEQPRQVRVNDELFGYVGYCPTKIDLSESVKLDDIRKYEDANYHCGDGSTLKYFQNASGTYNPNKADDPMFFNTEEDGYYIITRDPTELYIRNGHANGTLGAAYEANNYTTTFVNGVLQIDKDETAPVINIGTEFIIKEANDGKLSLKGSGDELLFLERDELRNNGCTIERTVNGTETNLIAIKCDGIVFTYEDSSNQTGTPTIDLDYIFTLLDWFDISSFDPSIMRAGSAIGKRYDPRWYITIQNDFDQRKVGDYTLFIHAQDIAGNISLASTATLRVVDTTAPEVGTLNLYDTKVKCTPGTDCNVETNWVVDGNVYLPIQTFTSERLAFLSETIKSKKYALSSTGVYSENNNFGTYYLIPDGTDARAVKHTGWTNSTNGVWMTVIGGDDNSLTYLDTSKYSQRYTAMNGSQGFSESASGTHLLLGNLISLESITKYRAVQLNASNDEVATGGTKTVYIPDVSGTIIRYKGYYYDLKAGSYIGTAPTDPEYTLKLYKKNGTAYEKITMIPEVSGYSATDGGYDKDHKVFNPGYYLLDGNMYEIPTDKYSVAGNGYKHDNNGTYVNYAQWDSYYTRDGGYSWAKYNRDTMEGYLALGQDGQRLIMIKAIDMGYTYESKSTAKDFVTDAYCHLTATNMSCGTWNDIAVTNGYDVSILTRPNVGTYSAGVLKIANVRYTLSGNNVLDSYGAIVGTYSAGVFNIRAGIYKIEGSNVFDEDGSTYRTDSDGNYDVYNGTKVYKYNISAWAGYDEAGNRDMKFAYLDTIMPIVNISNNDALATYEYDCGSDPTRCRNNHDEVFGKAMDSYVYELARLMKYKPKEGGGYEAVGYDAADGTYVYNYGSYVEITANNRLEKNAGKTAACIGGSNASDCMYYTSATGKYIYLGKVDTAIEVDDFMTGKIGNRLTIDPFKNNYTVGSYDATNNKLTLYGVEYTISGTDVKLDTATVATISGTTITTTDNKVYTISGDVIKSHSTETVQVFDSKTKQVYTVTLPTTVSGTSEVLTNLQANTWFRSSGIGMGVAYDKAGGYNTFDGAENVEKQFGSGTDITQEINDQYLTIFIYADVRGGDPIQGHNYLDAIGNYKFMIKKTVAATTTYSVLKCFNSTTPIHESQWCDSPASIGSFEDMKSAMNSVLAVYKDSNTDGENDFKFGGNNITFTVDYRVSDLAGNISMYVRKGILLSTFVTVIGLQNGAAATALSNRVELEVEQNGNVTQMLSNFSVKTKNRTALDTNERIVQTVYYNGIAVSENDNYDLSVLNNIDTSKPGEYKVVYTAQRKDGTEYINGNSVELVVTIKPQVANVTNNIDYIMVALIVISMASIATMAYISIRKKEQI